MNGYYLPDNVEELVNVIIHDIRSPFTVTGMAGRMIQDASSDSPIEGIHEDANTIVKHLSECENLLSSMTSLASSQQRDPMILSPQVVLEIHERIEHITNFSFQPKTDQIVNPDSLIVDAGILRYFTLLLFQDLLKYLGSVARPEIAISYEVEGRGLVATALLSPNPNRRLSIREATLRYANICGAEVDSDRVGEAAMVRWSFPLQ